MKCENCGRELAEGEVCDCTRPFEMKEAPRREGVLPELFGVYKSWWRSPSAAKREAREQKPLFACGILLGLVFLMTLWFGLFLVFAIDLKVKSVVSSSAVTFHFFRALLLIVVLFLLMMAVYFVGKLTAALLGGRRPNKDFFTECFVDCAVDSLPVPVILLLGIPASFLSPALGLLFGAGVFLYEGIALSAEFHDQSLCVSGSKGKLLLTYGVGVVLMIAVAYAAVSLAFWAADLFAISEDVLHDAKKWDALGKIFS